MEVTVTSEVLTVEDSPKASFAAESVASNFESDELVTVDQAKRQLKIVHADEDEHLAFLIRVAYGMLEQRTKRAIVPRQVTEYRYGFEYGMPLDETPYLDGLVVEYTDPDGIAREVDAANVDMDVASTPARVYPIHSTTWPVTRFSRGAVRLHYRAGYEAGTLPEPLQQWVLMAVATMYAQRESLVVGVSVASVPEDFMRPLYQKYVVYK